MINSTPSASSISRNPCTSKGYNRERDYIYNKNKLRRLYTVYYEKSQLILTLALLSSSSSNKRKITSTEKVIENLSIEAKIT